MHQLAQVVTSTWLTTQASIPAPTVLAATAACGNKTFFPLSCFPGPIAMRLLISLPIKFSRPLVQTPCASFIMKTSQESQTLHCPHMAAQPGSLTQVGHKVLHWLTKLLDTLKMQFIQLPGLRAHLFR